MTSSAPARREMTVRKGSSVVMARYLRDVEVDPVSLTIFNYLLLRSHNQIEPGAIHSVPVREVMDYARLDRAAKLHSALENLGRATIEIDYEEASGEGRSILAHFLSFDMSRTERGMLHFAFDPILATFLREPKVYSLVSIDRARDLSTVASIRLYELMKLKFNLKHAVQSFTVDELRDYWQVGNAHPRPDNFKKFVERAVDDVNAVADFHVLVRYQKGGKGGAIVGIEFEATPKSHARLIEAKSVRAITGGKGTRKASDLHTVDFLDGSTVHERGGPADLTQAAIASAREMMSDDDDVSHLVAEWRTSSRGRSMTDPDRAFLAWLELRLERDRDPVLKDVDSDVFGAILDGTSGS